jgi:hydroxymethylglutaryl-CoA lyase
VATEDVLYMLNGMGIETGVDIGKMIEISWFISDKLGRRPASRVAQAERPQRGNDEGRMACTGIL